VDFFSKSETAGKREARMSDSLASLFKSLTTGVYVVGVAHGEVHNAFTAAWLIQASFDPLLLALSINPHHSSYGLLKQGRAFSVNVLKKGQLDLAAHFGGRASADKLAATQWKPGRTGVPLLHQAMAWFECQLVGESPAGDHVMVLGRVIDGKLNDAETEPMIYRDTGDMDGAAALFPGGFEN
jgi:flavin reductase (DIM6/NTAB) family NADH-FMN oxidoreductase RutF